MARIFDWLRSRIKDEDKKEIPRPDPGKELASLRARLDERPSLNTGPLARLSNAAREFQAIDEQTELEEMKAKLKGITVVAFVGPSGTGKSTQAIRVSREFSIHYLIDDGLLVHGTSIVAGSSAKRSSTKIDSVRQALFMDETRAKNMRRALAEHEPTTLMILGTSDSMLDRICDNLWLERPSMLIRIEDVTTEEERQLAKNTRMTEGQHTIPVPSMEIKHEFSGYFQDYLSRIRRRSGRDRGLGIASTEAERTVVRPTFSTLGRYSISDDAMRNMIALLLEEVDGVASLVSCGFDKQVYGFVINIEIALYYAYAAKDVLQDVQDQLATKLEIYTSINILAIHVRAVRVVNKPSSRDLVPGRAEVFMS